MMWTAPLLVAHWSSLQEDCISHSEWIVFGSWAHVTAHWLGLNPVPLNLHLLVCNSWHLRPCSKNHLKRAGLLWHCIKMSFFNAVPWASYHPFDCLVLSAQNEWQQNMGRCGVCETFTCLAIDNRPMTKYGNGRRKQKLKRVDEWLNMEVGELWQSNKHAKGPYLVKGRNCHRHELPNEGIKGSRQRVTASMAAEASLEFPTRTSVSRSNGRNCSPVETIIVQGDRQLRLPLHPKRHIHSLQNYRRGHHQVWERFPVNSAIKSRVDCMCVWLVDCVYSIKTKKINKRVYVRKNRVYWLNKYTNPR